LTGLEFLSGGWSFWRVEGKGREGKGGEGRGEEGRV